MKKNVKFFIKREFIKIYLQHGAQTDNENQNRNYYLDKMLTLDKLVMNIWSLR